MAPSKFKSHQDISSPTNHYIAGVELTYTYMCMHMCMRM